MVDFGFNPFSMPFNTTGTFPVGNSLSGNSLQGSVFPGGSLLSGPTTLDAFIRSGQPSMGLQLPMMMPAFQSYSAPFSFGSSPMSFNQGYPMAFGAGIGSGYGDPYAMFGGQPMLPVIYTYNGVPVGMDSMPIGLPAGVPLPFDFLTQTFNPMTQDQQMMAMFIGAMQSLFPGLMGNEPNFGISSTIGSGSGNVSHECCWLGEVGTGSMTPGNVFAQLSTEGKTRILDIQGNGGNYNGYSNVTLDYIQRVIQNGDNNTTTIQTEQTLTPVGGGKTQNIRIKTDLTNDNAFMNLSIMSRQGDWNGDPSYTRDVKLPFDVLGAIDKYPNKIQQTNFTENADGSQFVSYSFDATSDFDRGTVEVNINAQGQTTAVYKLTDENGKAYTVKVVQNNDDAIQVTVKEGNFETFYELPTKELLDKLGQQDASASPSTGDNLG